MQAVAPIILEWADRYAREHRGVAAVFADCRQHGIAPGQARDMAQEAIQEGLTRVLATYGQRPERYAGGYNHFRHSVTRTALNHARDQIRRQRPQSPLDPEPVTEMGSSDRRLEALRAACELLPDNQRALVLLKLDEGCTFNQMADRLLPAGGTDNARRLRIYRHYHAALAALRGLLEQRYPDLDWEARAEAL